MIIESLAAMAVVFVLLVVIVQLAFVVIAHSASQAAIDAAARRAALPSADLVVVEQRLAEELAAVLPGAQDVQARVRSSAESVDVAASITWAPPGPDLVPIVISAESSTPRIVPP